MAVEVICPNLACQSRGKVSEKAIGKTIQCSKCGAKFLVEKKPTDLTEPPPYSLAPEPAGPACPRCGIRMSPEETLCAACSLKEEPESGNKNSPVSSKRPRSQSTGNKKENRSSPALGPLWTCFILTPFQIGIVSEALSLVVWQVVISLSVALPLVMNLTVLVAIPLSALLGWGFTAVLILSYVGLFVIAMRSARSGERTASGFLFLCSVSGALFADLIYVIATLVFLDLSTPLSASTSAVDNSLRGFLLALGSLMGSHILVVTMGWTISALFQSGRTVLGWEVLIVSILSMMTMLVAFLSPTAAMISFVLTYLCLIWLVIHLVLIQLEFILRTYMERCAMPPRRLIRVPTVMFGALRYWLGTVFCGAIVSPITSVLLAVVGISSAATFWLFGLDFSSFMNYLLDPSDLQLEWWKRVVFSMVAGTLIASLFFWQTVIYSMGLGAASVAKVLNPITVLKWIWKCKKDYALLIVMMLPWTVMYGVAAIICWDMLESRIDWDTLTTSAVAFERPEFSLLLDWLVVFSWMMVLALLFSFLFHHCHLVLYDAVGSVLNRNKELLGLRVSKRREAL